MDEQPRQPFWGPNWPVIPAILILIAVLTYIAPEKKPNTLDSLKPGDEIEYLGAKIKRID